MRPQARVNAQREILFKEYEKLFNNICLLPLVITGFLRVENKDGKSFKKASTNICNNIIFMVVFNLCVLYGYYKVVILTNNARFTEASMFLALAFWQDSCYMNLCIPNRNTRVDIINLFIDIDVHLGADETKFMRNIATRTFTVISVLVIFFLVLLSGSTMIWLHDMSWDFKVAAQICAVLCLSLFECSFFHALCISQTLRVRYLNVALIKIAKLNPVYFPRYFLFSALFWRRKFDDLVRFHKRANLKQFVEAFKMIFVQVNNTEKCYRFNILMSTIVVTVNTFLVVQSIIYYLLKRDENIFLILATSFPVALSWLLLIFGALHKDLFHEQIQQTSLICTYIQLKPSLPTEIIKLAESIDNTLKCRKPQLSVYGMFDYDTKMIIQMVAVIMVYIIAQLQLFYPEIKQNILLNYNVTAEE